MGTIERSESRTGRTESIVQPAFVIVGAPDTNKEKISDELARDFFTEQLFVHSGLFGKEPYLGMLSDYRVDTLIMAQRATLLHRVDRPTLYTHSLIDSLAYSLVRVDNQQTHQNVSLKQQETWALTMGLAGVMLRDTFKADEIFFVVGDFDPDTQYDNAKLEQTIGFILDGYEMNYHVIEPENAVDNIASIIAGYIPQP